MEPPLHGPGLPSASRAGEDVGGGEGRRPWPSLARLICWLSTLCDEDLDRIDREGGVLLAGLSRLPPDYGRTPGRADPMAIPRRAATVLVVEGPDGAGAPPQAASG